jgi:alginate O-acetyltransferase complex protein AlgI
MLFNSLDFAFFLPIIFILYWSLNKNLKIQNLLLLVSSYYFYSCWNYKFLFLLIFSTSLDYYTGIKMFEAKTNTIKKTWFWASIIINLGFLGIFKYYNFFIESFANAFTLFGLKINYSTLNVILPVGISFYTFHGLSYVIDIYKNRITPEKNFVNYSVFVSYFPLLVAGPIERATHLLPQIKEKRSFNYAKSVDGLRQILWGIFKKVVIADNCAEYANLIFENSSDYQGSTLFLGALLFTFQIYGDFSGYSDIALGTSRLFGIELIKNFSFPYFSRDIAEFWRRWHISLSTWFRDYLYIPLGGSKVGTLKKVRNTFIIFIVSGFWHGANWTFIMWGFLNALYIMPSIIFNTNRNNLGVVAQNSFFPNLKELISILFTFLLTTFAWIFFRANNITDAFKFIQGIFHKSILSIPEEKPVYVILMILIMIFIEWLGRRDDYALKTILNKKNTFVRWSFYIALIILTVLFENKNQQFIYFQF